MAQKLVTFQNKEGVHYYPKTKAAQVLRGESTVEADLAAVEALAGAAIPGSQKGAANGVAALGADSKIIETQLPAALLSAKDDAVSDIRGGVAEAGDTLAKVYALVSALQQLTQSDDVTLDTVQEIVAYIKEHESDLTLLGTNKVNISDAANNLTTTAAGKWLDARQGKALKDLIDALTGTVSGMGATVAGLGTVRIVSGGADLSGFGDGDLIMEITGEA